MATPLNLMYNRYMSIQKSYSQTMESNSEKLLISALRKNLSMSIEERVNAHENARQLVKDLSNSKKELSARSKEAS